ncbi:ribosome-associated translation inhibitor RaiA [Emcibacter sp. SYSU 3D8]|uniref:ribosome hibernation-promoting factor, HPF/YfiA family n=1 Tax=Emcibacter sp. SYSU 3D8 TaxID=3133969 RepID=UPI0031FF3BDA
MEIQVNGKQIDIGDALREQVTDRIEERVSKYFDRAVDAHVTFSRDAHLIRVDCSVHAGHAIVMQSHASAAEPYAAFDQALDRIETRLRRYKRRLRNHHAAAKASAELVAAASYVLEAEEEGSEEPEDLQPLIIAETKMEIPTTTVGGAVMRLDLSDAPVMMFRNSAHGRLNVVYRRPDGNIGWIDPQSQS